MYLESSQKWSFGNSVVNSFVNVTIVRLVQLLETLLAGSLQFTLSGFDSHNLPCSSWCFMMLNYNLLLWVPDLLLLFLVLRFGKIYWRLRHVPGPRLAAFTDLWRLITVWGGRAETTYLDLHKKYGAWVRTMSAYRNQMSFKASMASTKALSRQAMRRGDERRWLMPVTVRLLHRVAEHHQWSSRCLNGLHCRRVSTCCNDTPNRSSILAINIGRV